MNMEPQATDTENAPVMEYIESLRDPMKKRFALEYMNWVVNGRDGELPSRGALAASVVKNVCANIDSFFE